MEKTLTADQRKSHWAKCKSLMLVTLVIWFIFSFVVHFFVKSLNSFSIPVLNFQSGYYMAAQGSLIVFVILIFWFAAKQNQIDKEFGLDEEEEEV